MKRESFKLLRKLTSIPSPSGYEMRIQELIRGQMKELCKTVTTDVHGNVIGVLNPGAATRIMIAGHCDEIGFIITHIDDKGVAYFSSIGGFDPNVAVGQRVRISTARGSVFGVIGRKPIHLMDKGEAGAELKIHDLWLDIGARNKKDAQKVIAVGDCVTMDVGLEEMRNDLVAARGFDDRAGAFAVMETMRKLKGRKLDVAVYGVATVQEEVGLRGARTSAYGIDPHVGIAIDVGYATDVPGAEPKRTGEWILGKGPVLHRGPNINPVLEDLLESAARAKKIPYQVTAEPGATGTDANAMQINRSGAAAALISIPCRYLHTPVEVISLKDLDNVSDLIAAFTASLKSNTDFVPRIPKGKQGF